jgi:Protein of unknown function (DUF3500)
MKAPSLSAVLVAFATALAPLRAHDAGAEMATAAKNFLSALTPEQQTAASFAFADDERANWHFIPRVRKGLPIKEMTTEQRLLAHALLASGLSHTGYGKAVSIMSLESILAIVEKDRVGGPVRDPELYFFSIFGKPGDKAPWGWRLEGHHLALNFTIPSAGAPPAVTPSFFGTNPGEVKSGPRTGTRILGTEEDLGRELVKSLDDTQRKTAIILAEAPKEIFNDPKRVDPTKPEGLPHANLTDAQKSLLARLIKEYLFRHRPDIAAGEWARIEKAGLDRVFFAWAGGVEPGQPHYYRVQSDAFVLEYDNTQGEANHVHSIWRNFGRDFGQDALGKHVAESHR